MPIEKSVKEVQEILNTPKINSLKRPIIFGDKIDALTKGAGILIAPSEWKLKTPIPNYYYSKYNKNGEKVVGCRKEDGGTLVYKL
jgi:hypothetical protein